MSPFLSPLPRARSNLFGAALYAFFGEDVFFFWMLLGFYTFSSDGVDLFCGGLFRDFLLKLSAIQLLPILFIF